MSGVKGLKVFELFGAVGDEISVSSVSAFLKQAEGADVVFRIASTGGSAEHGVAIHDMIKAYKGKTRAEIIGFTASAATIIALACDSIAQSDNALFLIHNSWSSAQGNAAEMKKSIDWLEKCDQIMVRIYREKTGLSEDKIRELMAQEEWHNAVEAKELGLIDEVITGANMSAAANFKLTKFDRDYIADSIKNKLEAKIKSQLLTNKTKTMGIFSTKPKNKAEQEYKEEEVQSNVLLEDGEYQLLDGSAIVVESNMIVEVKPALEALEALEEEEEKEQAKSEEKEKEEKEEILEAVASLISELKAEFVKEISGIKAQVTSTHKPAKAKSVDSTAASYDPAKAAVLKAKEIKNQIKAKISN